MADRSCVVLVRHGAVLMVRQTYRGRVLWTFPGGAIEPGETPEQAAVREAREETGLEVAVRRRLFQAPRSGATGTYDCHLGVVVGGALALGTDPDLPPDAPPELHEVRWLPIASLATHPEVVRARPFLADEGVDSA